MFDVAAHLGNVEAQKSDVEAHVGGGGAPLEPEASAKSARAEHKGLGGPYSASA